MITDWIGFLVLILFGIGVYYSNETTIDLGFLSFGIFWLILTPHYYLVEYSIIESILAIGASLICLWIIYDYSYTSKEIISKGIFTAGLIYYPFQVIGIFRELLIETVARSAHSFITFLGYSPRLVHGGEWGYLSKIVFELSNGHEMATVTLLACTGIGSISVIIGMLSVLERVEFSKRMKFGLVSIPVIYVLNVFRVSFIAMAHGNQWFAWVPDSVVFFLFPVSNELLVSYLIADKVISQLLSVIVLISLSLYAFEYLNIRENYMREISMLVRKWENK